MNLIADHRMAELRRYVPCAVGNGDISSFIDYTGGMVQENRCGVTPGIWRAGVRYDNPACELVPFGYFVEAAATVSTRWSQTLEFEPPTVRARAELPDGSVLESEVFVPLDCPVIAVRWKKSSGPLQLRYHWRAKRTVAEFDAATGRIGYTLDVGESIAGATHLLSAGPVVYDSPEPGVYTMTSDASEAVFFLAFSDAAAAAVRALGWDGLYAAHRAAWSEYWAESKLPPVPGRLGAVCRSAEYHLRISATRWSIPTAIAPWSWQGRYFGFDEFFALGGLLAAGHFSTARRVPAFRAAQLPAALRRGYSYGGATGPFAIYRWESVENPDIEGAPPGFWLEHIFHMANIALGTRQYCEQSGDRAFLRESGYAVIRACAEFFRICACSERPGGRTVIDKCTDLERLGAARENPYLTTCGAIAALRAAADSAVELGCDDGLIESWRRLADALLRALPHNGERYIPYPGCPDSSIAMLGGIYPYAVVPDTDLRQRRAIDHYLDHEEQYGVMYPGPGGRCTWYTGWTILALTRLGRLREAEKMLKNAAEETGCFCEVFEIYSRGSRPYFTTGEGILLQAVAEYLTRRSAGR